MPSAVHAARKQEVKLNNVFLNYLNAKKNLSLIICWFSPNLEEKISL
jgi:hypothetical protein